MKLIIAGSRDFNNYELLCEIIGPGNTIDEVVCGGARGADSLGKRYAEERHIPIKMFPVDWDKYGRGAGYIRNEQMGNYADAVIAFWDGKSKGTQHMIDYMKKLNKKVFIYNYITGEKIVIK